MNEIGCISPYSLFVENSSELVICTNPDKALKAATLFQNLANLNLTEQNRRCPKPCKRLKSIVGGTSVSDVDGYGYLEVRFQMEIKVSRSQISYGTLELMAEVGGYFGLFLGVSVNQLSSFIKKCIVRFFDVTKILK